MNIAHVNGNSNDNLERYRTEDITRVFGTNFQNSAEEFADNDTSIHRNNPLARAFIMFVIILAVLPVLAFEFLKSWVQARF